MDADAQGRSLLNQLDSDDNVMSPVSPYEPPPQTGQGAPHQFNRISLREGGTGLIRHPAPYQGPQCVNFILADRLWFPTSSDDIGNPRDLEDAELLLK